MVMRGLARPSASRAVPAENQLVLVFGTLRKMSLAPISAVTEAELPDIIVRMEARLRARRWRRYDAEVRSATAILLGQEGYHVEAACSPTMGASSVAGPCRRVLPPPGGRVGLV